MIDLSEKRRQEWPQTIGQAKSKKAGEAAVDRQVDQSIYLKKERQKRLQSIGQAIGSPGEAMVDRRVDRSIYKKRKAGVATINWPSKSKEGRRSRGQSAG